MAITLIALPSEEEKKRNDVISLKVDFELVDQSKLKIDTIPPAAQSNNEVENIEIQKSKQNSFSYDAPVPSTLVRKNSPPIYKEHNIELVTGDSLSKVLSSNGVSAQDIYKISLADKKDKTLLQMKPGQTISFIADEISGQVTELTLILDQLDRVTFTRVDDKFDRQAHSRTPDIIQTYKEAIINNSLFVDGLRSGIDQSLLVELANIFGWDIDFALDIRKGDSLSLLYEEKMLDGKKIGTGNIIAAQFINNGRTYQAIRYKTSQGAHFYTPDGLAMRKMFIRTPVDFTRISSKFNPNRLHPIFKTSRPHRGVDYAAASGTPVKAAGDGKVSFAGKQTGYGNVVIIDHGRGYQTLYAHLKSFARGVKRGAKIKQGRIIAYVGQTGWATGPHLHYEFRINGVHKNPVTVRLPNDIPMKKKDLKKYLPYAKQIVATLANSHSPSFAEKLAALEK